MPSCAAAGCKNNDRSGHKLHRFPRDAKRSRVWVDVCCIPRFKPTGSSYLCQEHFSENQYETNRIDGRKLLKWNAVPLSKKKADSMLPPVKTTTTIPANITSDTDETNRIDGCKLLKWNAVPLSKKKADSMLPPVKTTSSTITIPASDTSDTVQMAPCGQSKSGGRYCAAVGCKSGKIRRSDLSFFRFPKDASRCQAWLVNCGRTDLDKFFQLNHMYLYDNCRLCSEHFEDSQFVNPLVKRQLHKFAVPTIFQGLNPSIRPSSGYKSLELNQMPITSPIPKSEDILGYQQPGINEDIIPHPTTSPIITSEDISGNPQPVNNENVRQDLIILITSPVSTSEDILGCQQPIITKDAEDDADLQLTESRANVVDSGSTLESSSVQPSEMPCTEVRAQNTNPAKSFAGDHLYSKKPSTADDDLPSATVAKDFHRRIINRQRVTIHRLRRRLSRAKLLVNQLQPRPQHKRRKFDQLISDIAEIIPPSRGWLALFIQSQLRLCKYSKCGRRYADSDKSFALSLHDTSPRAYRMCAQLFLLPSMSMVKQWKAEQRKSCIEPSGDAADAAVLVEKS